MSYEVLARKFRPQTLEELVGQPALVAWLRRTLDQGRIAPAYLFSGIRGIGKTSAARILAKGLNCLDPDPRSRPCNSCDSCNAIAQGRDVDVLEIDAATYSKVEQVRELAESLRYGPARGRFKVVILDEVHRLSRQAFDALLKLLEEPPPHLVFLFATTEIESVPATILSRCQEFHLRRVPASTLSEHLGSVAERSGIRASRRALEAIARAGEGSVRDAVALLDQLATFGNGEIREEDVEQLTGGLDLRQASAIFLAILDGNAREVSRLCREALARGLDPREAHRSLLALARDALDLALVGPEAAVDLPPEERAALLARLESVPYPDLLRLAQHLLSSEPGLRRSELPELAVELAWLRAAELPRWVRIEELLDGSTAPASPAPSPNRAAPAATEPAPHPPAPRSALPAAGAEAAEPVGVRARDELVGRILEAVSARRQVLAAQLEAASVEIADDELRILPLPGDTLLASALARDANRKLLEEVAAEVLGRAVRIRCRESLVQPEVPRADENEAKENLERHPRVREVLEVFGGKIAAVSPLAPRSGRSPG